MTPSNNNSLTLANESLVLNDGGFLGDGRQGYVVITEKTQRLGR